MTRVTQARVAGNNGVILPLLRIAAGIVRQRTGFLPTTRMGKLGGIMDYKIGTGLALLLLSGALQAADKTRLSLGLYTSTGDYGGASSTDIQSLSLSLRRKTGPWTLKASTAYLRVTGDASVLPDGDGTGTVTTRSTRSGMGDVSLSASRLMHYDKASGFGFSLRGKVKLPTASASRALGTGKFDFTAEIAPFVKKGDNTFFGSVGHLKKGDTSTTNYRDMWLGRIGWQHKFNAQNKAGVIARYRQRATNGAEDKRSIMAFHTYQIDRTWAVQSFAIVGLSTSTADLAGGLSLQHNF